METLEIVGGYIIHMLKWTVFHACASRGDNAPGLLRVLESPGVIFLQIFKAWKVLENRHGPWKSLNLCLKVLASAWIWFSKTRTRGKRIVFFLLPEAFCRLKHAENAMAAGAPPWTLLGELTMLPGPLSRLLMHLVHFSDNSSFWLMLVGVKLSNVNWTCLYMLIKVPVWVNLVLRIYPSYGPWKSLNLILTNGQEPWCSVVSGSSVTATRNFRLWPAELQIPVCLDYVCADFGTCI